MRALGWSVLLLLGPGEVALAASLDALALRREHLRMAALPLWPGFEPGAIPLAVYDGEATWLFAHPSPPAVCEAAGVDVRRCPGRLEEMRANGTAEIGGRRTATVLAHEAEPGDTTRLAGVAIHESFHAHQQEHHPGWQANEVELFTYPLVDTTLLAWRRLETRALAHAVRAEGDEEAARWAREALLRRGLRHGLMSPGAAEYERRLELWEGLARYLQHRAGSEAAPPASEGFPLEQIRARAYVTGAALATLLDRFDARWKGSLAAGDTVHPEDRLRAVLGVGETGRFSPAAMSAARDEAAREIRERAERLARIRSDFESRDGWRVVIEAAAGAPLWPQNFDPLNVERLGDGAVLHRRMLGLGHQSAELELLDAEAVTEAAGSHPLFEGVRRVIVTGLAEEPEIAREESAVIVRAGGLRVRAEGATWTREDRRLTIRLDSAGE